MANPKDDVLDRISDAFAENKPALIAAYNEADEQVRKWSARRDALRLHISTGESHAEHAPGEGRIVMTGSATSNGQQESLLDRVGNLIIQRPGLSVREIATALALKVEQASSACQRLKRAERILPPDAEGRYFPKPAVTMQ